MSGSPDDDARQGARAILGGRPLQISTAAIFSALEQNARIAPRELREARRVFDMLTIGVSTEFLEKANSPEQKFFTFLKLARLVAPYLRTDKPGWFRFLINLGSERGESTFFLSYKRRPKSESSMPKFAVQRDKLLSRQIGGMLVAGAILRRIGKSNAEGQYLSIDDAIDNAIDADEIDMGPDNARVYWKIFRKSCKEATNGAETYRIKRYDGPLPQYFDRWVAIPDIGIGLPRLPSAKGGRPAKTK